MTDNNDWFSPRDIKFKPEHIYFLIQNMNQLEQGDYPSEPSNYLDVIEDPTQYGDKGITRLTHPTRVININKLAVCAGLAAEVRYRLERCGKDGEILLKSVQAGDDFRYLSRNAQHALDYCSGWKRKKQGYSQWLADKSRKRRQKAWNDLAKAIKNMSI